MLLDLRFPLAVGDVIDILNERDPRAGRGWVITHIDGDLALMQRHPDFQCCSGPGIGRHVRNLAPTRYRHMRQVDPADLLAEYEGGDHGIQ